MLNAAFVNLPEFAWRAGGKILKQSVPECSRHDSGV